MVKAKKAVNLKKASIAKKKVAKHPVLKKSVGKNSSVTKSSVKKKATKSVVSKKSVKPAVKKKAVISMKKTTARPGVKKKVAIKVAPVRSKTKELRATIAALKQELLELKRDLKYAGKRANAMASLSDQRDVAVGKFLKSWDKKAKLALEKSFKPKKKNKKKS